MKVTLSSPTVLLAAATAAGLLLSCFIAVADAGVVPEVVDGHLRMLTRSKGAEFVQGAGGVERRHHAKRAHSRRGTCSSGSKGTGSTNSGSSGSSSGSSSSSASSSSGSAANTASVKVAAKSSNNSSSSSGVSSASSSSSGSSTAASSSVSSFSGTNSNAILSWFRTNSGSDSTNGQSWCQTKYQDDWICFALDVTTMLKEFGNDYNKAATAFCGLEATITNPATGKSITAFICDGFDSKWVKTPASLDLTVGAFTQIYGSFDNNKNTVIQGATWKLTGNVVSKGKFKSSG